MLHFGIIRASRLPKRFRVKGGIVSFGNFYASLHLIQKFLCCKHIEQAHSLQLTHHLLRKKKLTAHWKNFIHPLMWRCKWIELRTKELQSQASKYDRKVSAIERRKHMLLDRTITENSGTKSLPFPLQSRRKRYMKRRKRKRVESTTEITSYMSNHILFSGRGLNYLS